LNRIVPTAAAFYAVLVLAAYGVQRFTATPFPPAAAATPRGVALELALGAACALVLVGLTRLAVRVTEAGRRLARALSDLLGPLCVPEALALALLSGIGEELFFRGMLQQQIGYVGASVVFGLVHIGPGREFAPWTGFAVIAGFLFGGLVLLTGSLLAAVVAHAATNAINLVWIGSDGGEAPPPGDAASPRDLSSSR